MKKKIKTLALTGAILLLQGCFITNELGIQPLRSFTGRHVKDYMTAVGVFGFTGSIQYGYCRRYTNGDECRRMLGDANIAENALLAGTILSQRLDVNQTDFYTAVSVYKCETEFIKNMVLWPVLMLGSKERPSGQITVITEPADALREAAIVSALSSVEKCNNILDEPGPIFSSPFRETDGLGGFWQKQ
ncbi:MAG: hypothetical protein HS115_16095 [Spirochaetales bacterium]|nr:hypothetical protein [Spirochaetales bacterium]